MTAFADRRREVKTGIRDRTAEGIMVYRVEWEMSSQEIREGWSMVTLSVQSIVWHLGNAFSCRGYFL